MAQLAASWPDLEFGSRPFGELAPRDGALAAAIVHHVVRRWRTLTTLLDSALSQPLERVEPLMQGALLTGCAQLLLMEQAEYAVTDSMVEWSKRRIRPGAAGMVNAVLRKMISLRGESVKPPSKWWERADLLLLEDGRAIRLPKAVIPGGPVTSIAVQTSHSDELISGWAARWGVHDAARLALHSLSQPPIVIAGASDGLPVKPHRLAGFALWQGAIEELRGALQARPDVRVQDPASAAPVARTAGLKPQLIVDLCAGRGTKTRQLAALHPGAEIVATDVDDSRRRDLETAFRDHRSVRVLAPPEVMELTGRADLLLLDVPCSNSGVLARRPEAKCRFSRRRLESLTALQQQIVSQSLPLLARGGALLYATCSLEKPENEIMQEWIGRQVGVPGEIAFSTPSGLPGEDPAGYCDGGFSALYVRGAAS